MGKNEYKIDGLTSSQVKMVDILWNIDTPEELQLFVSMQPKAVQMEIRTLALMIAHAVAETEFGSGIKENHKSVDELLNFVRKKKNLLDW